MCSLLTNKTADASLGNIPKKHSKGIEKKFGEFAGNSTIEKAGILDLPQNHLHVLPPNLKDVRRRHAGRHRIFYVGHHTRCAYTIIYVKEFKKTGVNDEADSSFHNVLKRALHDTSHGRVLREPDKTKK